MEPFIGQIMAIGFNFAPVGWALCEGQLLQVNQYSALFALLGTTYGGDGRTTFGLPDLRGRTLIGQGRGVALSTRKWGDRLGEEGVNLTTNQIPSHDHPAQFAATSSSVTVKASSSLGTSATPGTDGATTLATPASGRNLGQSLYNANDPDVSLNIGDQAGIKGDVVIGNNGGSQAHNNMQPSLTVYYCIALQGLFPSRS